TVPYRRPTTVRAMVRASAVERERKRSSSGTTWRRTSWTRLETRLAFALRRTATEWPAGAATAEAIIQRLPRDVCPGTRPGALRRWRVAASRPGWAGLTCTSRATLRQIREIRWNFPWLECSPRDGPPLHPSKWPLPGGKLRWHCALRYAPCPPDGRSFLVPIGVLSLETR